MIETNLTAKGMAKYKIGFEFAFEEFEKVRKSIYVVNY